MAKIGMQVVMSKLQSGKEYIFPGLSEKVYEARAFAVLPNEEHYSFMVTDY